jgi:hypothetical protein
MPVRKVSNRGRKNVIGKFPSLKMQRMVSFESTLELDYIHLLEYEREVSWFEEQPLTIEYEFEGESHHYTPDFHVIRLGQDWLIECKPDKFVDTGENQRKFSAAESWCEDRGWFFKVVTDEELRSGYRLKNVKFLWPFARHSIGPAVRSRVYAKLLEAETPLTVLDLANYAEPGEPTQGLIAVYLLAFRHEVAIPLDDAPISVASPVTLPLRRDR